LNGSIKEDATSGMFISNQNVSQAAENGYLKPRSFDGGYRKNLHRSCWDAEFVGKPTSLIAYQIIVVQKYKALKLGNSWCRKNIPEFGRHRLSVREKLGGRLWCSLSLLRI